MKSVELNNKLTQKNKRSLVMAGKPGKSRISNIAHDTDYMNANPGPLPMPIYMPSTTSSHDNYDLQNLEEIIVNNRDDEPNDLAPQIESIRVARVEQNEK